MSKRAFDIVGALVGLVLSAPAWPIATAAILISSRGPILHRATRVGRGGRPFTLYKFRTMRVGDGPSITRGGDPRVTSLGRFLRASKLDELPQLWNVLIGDMSLVGPRPEDPRFVERYTAEQRRVLQMRPGITSLAAIRFRDEEELLKELGGDLDQTYLTKVLPAKLELDLEYVRRASLRTDVAILLRTAGAVLTRRERGE